MFIKIRIEDRTRVSAEVWSNVRWISTKFDERKSVKLLARKNILFLFLSFSYLLLSAAHLRARDRAMSISDTEGKFDPAIIVFPEIEGTVVAGNGDRLTELWLSLSSHHCHATLNSWMGRGGDPATKNRRFSNIKPPTGVFLENRPGLLPRQSVIYFPPDLPPTRRRISWLSRFGLSLSFSV